MFWMASGMYYEQAANGNRLKKNGSTPPIVSCMSVFKHGKAQACLKNYLRRWSNTMPESAKLVGMAIC